MPEEPLTTEAAMADEPPVQDHDALKERLQNDNEIIALKQEKDRIMSKIEQLENIPMEECQENALAFIQCDDKAKYGKKIKGFVLPFSTKAKANTEEWRRLNKAYKFKRNVNDGL